MNSQPPPAAVPPKIPPRRMAALLLPTLISLGLLALILVWEERNPPGWQRAMENHLAAYVASPREMLSAGKATVAQLPFLLSPQTPFQPVTPSVHYQTEPLPANLRPDGPESLGGGKQPLPYPVLELYCIDLTGSAGGVAATRYLVAEHRDLNSSDWIVYIPADRATAEEVAAAWEGLGCAPEG
ncbi:MAG: hypothetical protein KJZ86_25010 [Caldilineaceae bacterium]|nr:hypothetical protein [Caldilineaceae bacterium]